MSSEKELKKVDEEVLDQVAGGSDGLPTLYCEQCGTKMQHSAVASGPSTLYVCPKCGNTEEI